MTRSQPSAASRSATARPSLLAAPVTRATRGFGDSDIWGKVSQVVTKASRQCKSPRQELPRTVAQGKFAASERFGLVVAYRFVGRSAARHPANGSLQGVLTMAQGIS